MAARVVLDGLMITDTLTQEMPEAGTRDSSIFRQTTRGKRGIRSP